MSIFGAHSQPLNGQCRNAGEWVPLLFGYQHSLKIYFCVFCRKKVIEVKIMVFTFLDELGLSPINSHVKALLKFLKHDSQVSEVSHPVQNLDYINKI